ncbi:MAG: GrpB family protein [bacterium]|nr:GrpB family protein [bacterium]
MIREDQKKWVNHLSDDSKIRIAPFDPSSQEKFEKVRSIIQSKLGKTIKIEHRGATSLGISGQDEIDIYIPVSPEIFDSYVIPLTELFGEPKSHYPLERVRFVTSEAGKHIDVFLINKESLGWLECIKFEHYLKNHTGTLEEYKQLKESIDGVSVKEYYRRKIEFINSILEKA